MDTDFILWIQQFSNDFLDGFFVLITTLGNRQTYIIILPLFYWCFNKRETFRLGLFLLISAYINILFKTVANVARPDNENIRVVYEESTGGTPSFPSGHAQGSTSLFGYILYYNKNKVIRIGAVVLILLISLSRVYLGLHYLVDVLVGITVAIGLLIGYNFLYEPVAKVINSTSFRVRVLLSVVLPIVLLILPGYNKGMVLGFAAGMLLGYQLENRYIRFDVKASLGKQTLKYVVGMMGFLGLEFGGSALYSGFGFVTEVPIGLEFLQYMLIGLWAFLIGPWIFVKLGLAKKEKSI